MGETIDRDAAISALNALIEPAPGCKFDRAWNDALAEAKQALRSLPAVPAAAAEVATLVELERRLASIRARESNMGQWDGLQRAQQEAGVMIRELRAKEPPGVRINPPDPAPAPSASLEALLAALDEASKLNGERAQRTNYGELCRRAAAALREAEALAAKYRDALELAKAEREALRAQLTEAAAKPLKGMHITVREACRRRLHLEGADAQALESALTMTEKERDALRAAVVAPCDRCGHGKSADWKALESRAERAERTILRVCQALGCVYQADGHADAAADEATILDHIEQLSAGEGQQRARAEKAEAERDALRGQLKHVGDLNEERTRQWTAATVEANEAKAALTAERAAHEETRRLLSQATDELTNVATTLGLPEEAPVAAMCEAIGEMQRQLAAPLAPIGAEWREELDKVYLDAWTAASAKGGSEQDRHERGCAAGIEAVARRVVERVRERLLSPQAICDFASEYEHRAKAAKTNREIDDALRTGMRAALSVALGDLSTGAGNSPTSSDGSPIDVATRDALAKAHEAAAKWPTYNSAHEAFGVLLEEVDELKRHVWTKQRNRDLAGMRGECLDVAAVAIRFAAETCDEERGRK
jgi:hypothetical protein